MSSSNATGAFSASKRNDAIIEAINSLKEGEFQATAIKIELEANLERYDSCKDIHLDIMRGLTLLGLANKNCGEDNDECDNNCYTVNAPLMYANTYDDCSVDTELTFTLSLADPTVVFKLPQILKIFKDVCEEHGDYFDVDRAGMHIALINDKDCIYDPNEFKRSKPYDCIRFRNFSQSMIRLLPALYFLGSWNENSRKLEFRKPRIATCNESTNHRYDASSDKYSAVAFRHGAIEFRVFETCYDNPEAILDYIVVIGNAMRFWTRAYTRNGLHKIPKMPNRIFFGHNQGTGLKRFYTMEKHIDLLNAGLKILKPQYYTINELKKQRNFSVTKSSLRKDRKELRLEAAKEYEQYEKRHKWAVIYEQQEAIRMGLEHWRSRADSDLDMPVEKVMKMLNKAAQKQVRYVKSGKQTKRTFMFDEMQRRKPVEGDYELFERRVASFVA